MRPTVLHLMFTIITLAGCGVSSDALECHEARQCTLRPGGTCATSDSGREWCRYPDLACASALRWSEQAGEGLAGQCVTTGSRDSGAFDGSRASDAQPTDGRLTDGGPNIPDGPLGAPDAPLTDAPSPDAPPGEITLDRETFSFGANVQGQPAVKSFTVTNAGSSSTSALMPTLTGDAQFTLDGIDCADKTLAPGETCSVTVTFTADSTEVRHATLSVSANEGGTANVTLDGSGLSPAALAANPPSLDFATVTQGTTSTKSVMVTNNGAATTGTVTTSITGTHAALFAIQTDACVSKNLAQGQSCTVSVRFAPTTAGSKGATLTIGSGDATATIPLSGQAVTPPSFSMNPSPVPFGQVDVTSSETQTVTVRNTGGTSATQLSASLTGADAASFTVGTDSCSGSNLAAAATCTIRVAFSPTTVGSKTATLGVTSTNGASSSVTLSGTGEGTISVAVDGTGSGSVTSSPAAISCNTGGGTCGAAFTTSSVMLTAAAGGDSNFAGWSGGGCTGMGACTVNVNQSSGATIRATFNLKPRVTVRVEKTGMGLGTVTSSTGGINCGTTCSEGVIVGNSITLTSTPTGGFAFTGWSGGGCSGSGTCTVTPAAMTTVTATFQDYLVVSVRIYELDPQGGGTISSSPAGLDCSVAVGCAKLDQPCSKQCSGSFPRDTTLTVTATPASGTLFGGWQSDGDSTCGGRTTDSPSVKITKEYTNPCQFVVGPGTTNVANNVTFGSPYPITLTATNTQAGDSVTSIPAGISCPGTCTAMFPVTGNVLFSATAVVRWTTSFPLFCIPSGDSPTCLIRNIFATSSPLPLEVYFYN